MSEADEQRVVIEYCEWRHIPIFHIPNGGHRDKRTGYQMKLQGVKPGVPDLFMPIATEEYHGLFIEMKRADGGRMTKPQKEWQELLNANGYLAVVCHGADEAIGQIGRYMQSV